MLTRKGDEIPAVIVVSVFTVGNAKLTVKVVLSQKPNPAFCVFDNIEAGLPQIAASEHPCLFYDKHFFHFNTPFCPSGNCRITQVTTKHNTGILHKFNYSLLTILANSNNSAVQSFKSSKYSAVNPSVYVLGRRQTFEVICNM